MLSKIHIFQPLSKNKLSVEIASRANTAIVERYSVETGSIKNCLLYVYVWD